ncbi:hypothetical protein K1T71_005277, partial [Dendrolimus kikuchii]
CETKRIHSFSLSDGEKYIGTFSYVSRCMTCELFMEYFIFENELEIMYFSNVVVERITGII